MNKGPLTLVVEDETLILELLQSDLLEAGFTVAKAMSAEEAIDFLERDGARIAALVTDVNFAPGKKTGWDVATRARELHPDMPVIYMTGASASDWASRGVPKSVLIGKPFAPLQVVTAISNLLNHGD